MTDKKLDTNQFLGRTGGNWAKILLFYIIFYAVLTVFFAAMMWVFLKTIDYKEPKWKLDSSLIGQNPGLGFRPMPPDGSTLIWYKQSEKGNVRYWQRELNKFLAQYNISNNPHKDKVEDCRPFQPPSPGNVCNVKFDPPRWHHCVKENEYNYESSEGGPCIFLKLNRIYKWVPEYFNSTSVHEAKTMSPLLREEIIEAEKYNQHHIVWISCEGENAVDVEHVGPIQYIPQNGFLPQYFPYMNQDGYLSPLVAVYFEKPTRGVLINIECKAWARNIHHDRADQRGSVHFKLMVE